MTESIRIARQHSKPVGCVGDGTGLLLLRLRLVRVHLGLCGAGFFANRRSCLNRIGVFFRNNSVLSRSRAFVFVLLVITGAIILLGMVCFFPLTFDVVVSMRFLATSSVVLFLCWSRLLIIFVLLCSRILDLVLVLFGVLCGRFIFIFGWKRHIIPFLRLAILVVLLTAIFVVVTRTIIVTSPLAASLVVFSATGVSLIRDSMIFIGNRPGLFIGFRIFEIV